MKVKPIWILLKQETVSGSGKSAPRFRQITTLAPHQSFFTGRVPFLPPNQQCQSTEGTTTTTKIKKAATTVTFYASQVNTTEMITSDYSSTAKSMQIQYYKLLQKTFQ